MFKDIITNLQSPLTLWAMFFLWCDGGASKFFMNDTTVGLCGNLESARKSCSSSPFTFDHTSLTTPENRIYET